MGYPTALPAENFETKGGFECKPCTNGGTFAQTFALGPGSTSPDVEFAPAAGKITSWRVTGAGELRLRVIESGPEGGWVGVGRSAPATDEKGGANPTSLSIGFDDMIGVDFPTDSSRAEVDFNEATDPEVFEWGPTLADGGEFREPDFKSTNGRLTLSAEVVLAPVVASLSPATGSTAGGNAVTIAGKYLDGTTSVTFGSTPASSFSIDSPSQIAAIAPATAASTVDVRVTGPGGSSEVSPADRYTFAAPTTNTGPPSGGQLISPPPVAKLAVSGFSESATKWRRSGRRSGKGAAPLGATFNFSLDEPATVSFAFTKRAAGRRVRGRCVGVSPGNAGKPKCKRTVSAGSLRVAGQAGHNKVPFTGRLTGGKTLGPGAYGVTLTAVDTRGLRAVSPQLAFTIVSG
jgi:hypothetical protein